MTGERELQVQQKREVEKAQEQTTPMRAFLPTTDIYETEDALTVVLEMPGVDRDNIDVNVENGVLTVEGKINFGISMRDCSPSTANTTSVRIGEAFVFRAGSTRTTSELSCGTG
jgi:Hsp20/alpha crystallin family